MAGGGTVDASGVSGTITLSALQTPTLLQLSAGSTGNPLIIIGPSGSNTLTISAQNISSVFQVEPGITATISDITIADGQAGSGDGGDILNDGGTLTLTTCTLVGATSGGSIVNSANDGGAIFNSGKLTMTGCTVTACQVSSAGGGIDNTSGSLTMTNCTVSDSSATNGGGIENAAGSLSLTQCTISGGSTAVTHGVNGATYNDSSLLKMSGERQIVLKMCFGGAMSYGKIAA